MRETKSQESRWGERREREDGVALSRETAPSLEIDDGGGGVRSGHEEEEDETKTVRSCGYLKDFLLARNFTLMLNFSAAPFIWGRKTHSWDEAEESLLSAIAEREERSWRIWRVGNEAAVNLFLIDQSLSKGKGKRGKENKHSEMLIWNRDTSENRLDYLIIIFAFGWRLWCECDCGGFPSTL